MLFSGRIGMGSQLLEQTNLQCGSFDARTSRDRFGQDMAALSLLSEISLDGRCGNGKRLGDFGLALPLLDRSQHTLPQILGVRFHAYSLS